MKFKTMARVAGAASAGTGCFLFYMVHRVFADPALMTAIQSDNPQYKTIAAACYAIGTSYGLAGSLFMIDGVSDIYTGTHHSGGLKILREFTRSQKIREQIDREIEHMKSI
jgi:hypothetical protein